VFVSPRTPWTPRNSFVPDETLNQMNLQTVNGAPPSPKPAILCLHGGGTNAVIFSIQTIRIQRFLDSHFEFVFLDAPFETGPGPGVLPVFEGCDPYFRWISDLRQVEKPDKTRNLLLDCFEKQRKKDGRGFVGVLGFSQGARVAAGLLLEQQLRTPRVGTGEGLRFGIFMNGTCPPLVSGFSDLERMERIVLSTLSIIGTQDPWREDGRRLYSEHCDKDQAVLLEFDIGHRVPLLEQDTAKIVAEILRMYRETSGEKFELLNGTT
jgi:predicted esterase